MAAYRRVYDSRHLQADCREPGSAPDTLGNRVWATFFNHINATVTKAHKRACLILRCFKSKDHSLLFRAFTTYVRPLLEYNFPVWSPRYVYLKDKLE